MIGQQPFKWRHFSDVILLNVCWYRRYSLSYRDSAEMNLEREVAVDDTNIFR
jgi:transposase-like protein